MSRKESGQVILTYAISTIGGILFLGLFYNLASYIGAQSAVDHAARTAARCLSPTDGACVRAATPLNIANQWWGERNDSHVGLRAWRHVVPYTASMPVEQYTASFNTYLISTVQPQFHMSHYQVPLVEFRPEFAIATVQGRFRQTSGHYQPKVEEFPTFDRDTNQSWVNWQNANSQFFEEDYTDNDGMGALLQTRRILPGDTTLVSVTVNVPNLLEDPSLYPCYDSNGNPCDAASKAITAGSTPIPANSWRDTAYVAIKILSQVRPVDGGSTSVRWGVEHTDPLQRAGLYIDIYNPGESAPYHTICLGGRGYTNVSEDSQNYNLWMRGPANSIGGTEPSCPNGDVAHDNIAVPRGGRFTIRAYMKASSSSGPADADIIIAWMFDDYDFVTTTIREDFACTADFDAVTGNISAPTTAMCEIPSTWDYEDHGPKNIYNASSCLDGSNCIQTETGDTTYSIAVCSDDYHIDPARSVRTTPTRWDNVSAELEQKQQTYRSKIVAVSNWQRRIIGIEDVANVPPYCPSATEISETVICQPVPVGIHIKPNDCQAFADLQNYWESHTNNVNTSQKDISGAAIFGTTVRAAKFPHPASNEVKESWVVPTYNSQIYPSSSVTPQHHTLQDKEHFIKRYKATQKQWQTTPDSSEFLAAIAATITIPNNDGWAEFESRVSELVKVIPTPEAAPQKITGVYPLTNEASVIYHGQVYDPPMYSFNLDCSLDATCPDFEGNFDTATDYVRYLVARNAGIPEADEKIKSHHRYIFELNSGNAEKQFIGEFDVGAPLPLDIPQCTPLITECITYILSREPKVDLGQSDSRPTVCNDGTYDYCWSEPVNPILESEELDSSDAVTRDYKLATQIAFREVQRIMKYAQLSENKNSCSTPGCVSVNVYSPDEQRVQAIVEFTMPLVFPLNVLQGTNSLLLRGTAEESFEIANIGF